MLGEFRSIWLVDFEYSAPLGENPNVVCLVAREYFSGETIRMWKHELYICGAPPFSISEHDLVVAYYASAEISCFLALKWPLPYNVLDLYAEFRCHTNGRISTRSGLLEALNYFGIQSIDTMEKESMRQLAMRGSDYTQEEQAALLNYCESDVIGLEKLLSAMLPHLDIPRALLRGKYMQAAARIERSGVPIDTSYLQKLQKHWGSIIDALIERVDNDYHVYEGRIFKMNKFEEYLALHGIPWPRLSNGHLDLKDDTFRDIAKTYPQLHPLRELRSTLSKLRLNSLAIGADGRNRCLLSAFSARTGRNQPSNSKSIFGPDVWMRSLIKPVEKYGLAYIDWSQQEFGIAAALSGDERMMEAYLSGDPYLEFAKQAGAVPQQATKRTHPIEREAFKSCVLAVQYGMSEFGLAQKIGQPTSNARLLLELHRTTYKTFWRWSDAVRDYAMLKGKLWTVFGWEIHVTQNPNPRFLCNFPMQANGAEMMRLASIYGIERGVNICLPVHDAFLIEAPLSKLDTQVQTMQQAMADASRVVLDGFELRSDAKIICYPERYVDERGAVMWQTINELLEAAENAAH
jgi:DNA polymerase I